MSGKSDQALVAAKQAVSMAKDAMGMGDSHKSWYVVGGGRQNDSYIHKETDIYIYICVYMIL